MEDHKKFYGWSYRGPEFERVLSGGVNAINVEQAKNQVMRFLNLKQFSNTGNFRITEVN